MIPTFTAEEIAFLIARGAPNGSSAQEEHQAPSEQNMQHAHSSGIAPSHEPPSAALSRAKTGSLTNASQQGNAAFAASYSALEQDAGFAQTSEIAQGGSSLHSQETELLPEYMKTYEQTSEEDLVQLDALRRSSQSPEVDADPRGWSLQTVALLGALGGVVLTAVIFWVVWWSLR